MKPPAQLFKEAKIALKEGEQAMYEYLRVNDESVEYCTCGKGDEAPAIVHADDCPCVDWVYGNLEGGSDENS